MDFLHEFYLRYNDKQFIIDRFDPNRYSYLNLVDDIDKWVLANTPSSISYTVKCRVLDCSQYSSDL